MKIRKHYTSEEKTIILREHLENQISVSDIAEKYHLHPNAIYKWKKQMFETAPLNLSLNQKKIDKQQNDLLLRITELETTLAKRESLIAELVEENISLKKKGNGDNLTKNGLNRR